MKKIKIKRYVKYKYLLLLRSPGGAHLVARGFTIGLAVEFITLITLGVAFLLIFPLVRVFKGSIPAAMIGFVFGKLILPLFLPMGAYLGHKVIHLHSLNLPWGGKISNYLSMFIAMLILGLIVAALCYFPIYLLYGKFQKSRIEKRKKRADSTQTKSNT